MEGKSKDKNHYSSLLRENMTYVLHKHVDQNPPPPPPTKERVKKATKKKIPYYNHPIS